MRDLGVPSGVVRLRLLGSLGLENSAGEEVPALIAQPKRLALLAYLAAAEPLGLTSRDVLLALFWPQQDEAHARAALRRALHLVRRALGAQAIVTRGDDVGAAPDMVWCDVAAFRVARAEGRWEDALELYRGDLLPGFFVSSAPDFERWMENERGRLRLMASACARDLAARARRGGDHEAELEWARRAVALDPDDETAARVLVTLLDEQGDRAAALQAYEALARRLREELGLEPSPESQALAARVRSRRDVRAPAITIPSEQPEPSPNVIAVFPFAVRGPEELTYLGDGLVDLLITKLDGAGELRTVDPRPQLSPATEIDRVRARALARRFGAGLALLGSVTVAGRRLHLRASLVQVLTDTEVLAEASGEDERALFDVVDDLVRQLLARQTASIGGHMARLAARTTSSLTALKAYLTGERAFRTGRYSEAVSAFSEAIDHDGAFFLARYRLAAAQAATGRVDEARSAASAAWVGRLRLTDHHRLLLTAQIAWLDGALANAENAWLQALDERPEDVEAWYHLGHLLFEFNPLRGRSALEGRGPLERTVALDSKHVAALGLLVRLAALEHDRKRVGSLAERLLALSPAAEQALVVRAIRVWAGDDDRERDAVRNALVTAPPRLLVAVLREVATTGRDLPAVEALALEIVRLPTAVRLGPLPYLVRAHLARRRDDDTAMHEALEAAHRLEPTESLLHRALITLRTRHSDTLGTIPEMEKRLEALTDERGSGFHAPVWPHARAYLLGLCAAVTGRDDVAERHAERCATLEAPAMAPELCHNLAAAIRAEIAWSRGDAVRALEHLEARKTGRGAWLAGTSPLFGAARERQLHALALHRLDRHEESEQWRAGLGQRSPFDLGDVE